MTTRAQFLGRVRAEMAKTRGLFAATSAPRPLDAAEAASRLQRELAERWPKALERFTKEFERVSGVFHRVRTVDEAHEAIGRIARERGVRRVITWSAAALGWDPIPGLARQGLEAVAQPSDGATTEQMLSLRNRHARAGIGVTGADLVLAETGSVVLFSGPGRARSTSLLPPYHVAIFGKGALVETLEQAGVILEVLHASPDEDAAGASVSFLTGPSRTADIELTLTQGVHGPKELHAIFVDSL